MRLTLALPTPHARANFARTAESRRATDGRRVSTPCRTSGTIRPGIRQNSLGASTAILRRSSQARRALGELHKTPWNRFWQLYHQKAKPHGSDWNHVGLSETFFWWRRGPPDRRIKLLKLLTHERAYFRYGAKEGGICQDSRTNKGFQWK